MCFRENVLMMILSLFYKKKHCQHFKISENFSNNKTKSHFSEEELYYKPALEDTLDYQNDNIMFLMEEELVSDESETMPEKCTSIVLRKNFPEAWIWDSNSTVLVFFFFTLFWYRFKT